MHSIAMDEFSERKQLPDLLDLRRLGIVQVLLKGSPQRVPPVNKVFSKYRPAYLMVRTVLCSVPGGPPLVGRAGD